MIEEEKSDTPCWTCLVLCVLAMAGGASVLVAIMSGAFSQQGGSGLVPVGVGASVAIIAGFGYRIHGMVSDRH